MDTSDLWKVQEVQYTADFRDSRWISVRISNPAEDVIVWTNVVREPNAWRPASRRSWNHYVNWHTQWGERQLCSPATGASDELDVPAPAADLPVPVCQICQGSNVTPGVGRDCPRCAAEDPYAAGGRLALCTPAGPPAPRGVLHAAASPHGAGGPMVGAMPATGAMSATGDTVPTFTGE